MESKRMMRPESEPLSQIQPQSATLPAHLLTVPDDLPVPTDDGLADHLRARVTPVVELPKFMLLPATPVSSGGEENVDAMVDLRALSFEAPVLVFVYPRTGKPGVAPPEGWDAIPGARGCTPELCSVRDTLAELRAARPGGVRIVALSTQSAEYQTEVATRLALPYPILSDAAHAFSKALRLPTFEAAGMVLLKRITLLVYEGKVVGRDYPVFPTNQAANRALALLRLLD